MVYIRPRHFRESYTQGKSVHDLSKTWVAAFPVSSCTAMFVTIKCWVILENIVTYGIAEIYNFWNLASPAENNRLKLIVLVARVDEMSQWWLTKR